MRALKQAIAIQNYSQDWLVDTQADRAIALLVVEIGLALSQLRRLFRLFRPKIARKAETIA